MQKINSQRRSALKTIAATTLLTTATNPLIELLNATFGKTLLQPSEAKANEVKYPPGIATCRDKAIRDAYYVVKTHHNYGVALGRIFEGIMRISDSMYLPNDFPNIVKSDTPYIEPAYWFLCAMKDETRKSKYYNKELYIKNPSLAEFAMGISDYFHEFIYKGWRGMETEKNLLNAIFAAAYGEEEMEKKTQEYLKADFEEKTRIIKETAKIFQNMHIDPNNNKPNDNYDKALTAQWASFILTGYHYRLEGKGKTAMLIYNLEQSFKSTGKEKIDLRIRAGKGEASYGY